MSVKGEILRVGGWCFEHDTPVGWLFAGGDGGVTFFTDGFFTDGRPPLFNGYTTQELRAIYEERTKTMPNVQVEEAVRRMRAWANNHGEADTQGLMPDEWENLARMALGLPELEDPDGS